MIKFILATRRVAVAALAALLGMSAFLLAFLPAFSPAIAANDDDCILDRCADRKPAAAGAPTTQQTTRQATQPGGGNFDFYVLALSWSPGFCDGANHMRDQCEPGRDLGFVVHGLWPQYERGFPSDCAGASSPSRVALEKASGLFPDERLARYEWRKHGTCSGKSPSDYFADVARARAMVTIPPLFEKPAQDQHFAPIDVERAFYAANARLRPGMMAVGCRRGVMEEVRVCLTKDLREFRVCPEVVRRGCHAREIVAPAPL